jgi:hypothetical protein
MLAEAFRLTPRSRRVSAAWRFPPNQSFLLKGTPEIFVSYAWGDYSSADARQRGEVVERMCETLERDGWKVVRDKTAMRYGELISAS